jgi:hypothetical protein
VILLVSHRGDGHLAPVAKALRRRGARHAVLDTGRFPWRGRLALRLGAGPPGLRLDDRGRALDAARVRAVWWRRPRPFAPDPAIPLASHREFAYRETAEAFAGLWACLEARWVNDPDRELAAGRKVWQLELARRSGLEVPRTCVASDPRAARDFLAEVAPAAVVYKGLQAAPDTWRETRVLGRAERALLPLLRHAPAIFQERIPGVDVRVTAVGRRIFAAEIDVRGAGYDSDFRIVFERARVGRLPLPAAVAGPLRRLLDGLGLAYAAVDLRRTEEGRWVFLEVNPSGQWLFVEERTGQPITEALAGLLAGGGG